MLMQLLQPSLDGRSSRVLIIYGLELCRQNTWAKGIFYRSAKTFRIWKYVLDHRYLLKKGIRLCLGNENKIRIWYDNWMEESPLIEKVPQERKFYFPRNRISQFIDENKCWKIRELKEILPTNIVDKIINIPIPINDIQDKII